ncbi:unnamed protein product [Polarella glacialis]|uniref:Uncharacterized protein n=1 Tax=Polarella glacialis TaxID=89957 RepID=A0A813LFG4_POLGL|nr:unnamed protein product [Polarella glacialis]
MKIGVDSMHPSPARNKQVVVVAVVIVDVVVGGGVFVIVAVVVAVVVDVAVVVVVIVVVFVVVVAVLGCTVPCDRSVARSSQTVGKAAVLNRDTEGLNTAFRMPWERGGTNLSLKRCQTLAAQ